MPFASNKTQEQLALEAKQKSEALVKKAIKCVTQVSGKRTTAKEIKDHIKSEILPLLEALAHGVGPNNK